MFSKRFSKSVGVVIAAGAAMAMVVPMAQATTPNPGYTQFAGCPDSSENPAIITCIRADVTGGKFKLGNRNVPISQPLTLKGGVEQELAGFDYNSEGGLSKTKLPVPGGVVGLTGLDWLVDFLNVEQLKLYAVAELAGTPELHNIQEFTLPIKVHLINPVLGSSCYVGSTANPVVLNLTTGTTSPPPPNEPISGVVGKATFDESTEILSAVGGVYVDNAFEAPGANGCVLNLGLIPVNIDSVVNLASGLPAAAGTNEAVQNVDLQIVAQELVY